MNSFLSELIEDQVVICPTCNSSKLSLNENQLRCSRCGTNWPVSNLVPDLFNQYRNNELSEVSVSEKQKQENSHLSREIIQALELKTVKNLAAVESIVAKASLLSCADNALAAEIRDLRDRFLPQPNRLLYPKVSVEANKKPEILLERHYFPREMFANTKITCNIRVKNTGSNYWSSRTEQPLSLSLYWTDNRAVELALPVNPVRFPVDIQPGRSISVPIFIRAPSMGGRYQLNVCLLSGIKRVNQGCGGFFAIEIIHKNSAGRPINIWGQSAQEIKLLSGKGIRDYGKDHRCGCDIFTAELLKLKGQHCKHILEIASGSHPQTAWIPDSKVLALDISLPLLELGNLFFAEKELTSKVTFICADAMNPPLKEKSFDAIAMFSALHHFPEPENLLKKLALLIRDGGFIAVMCEPVSDTLEATETVRDLLKGINEQVFSWQEYVYIFSMAGLSVVKLQLDGGSLKAILTPQRHNFFEPMLTQPSDVDMHAAEKSIASEGQTGYNKIVRDRNDFCNLMKLVKLAVTVKDKKYFVTLLYVVLLNREPDSEGLSHYLKMSNNIFSRLRILYSFLVSSEYRSRL